MNLLSARLVATSVFSEHRGCWRHLIFQGEQAQQGRRCNQRVHHTTLYEERQFVKRHQGRGRSSQRSAAAISCWSPTTTSWASSGCCASLMQRSGPMPAGSPGVSASRVITAISGINQPVLRKLLHESRSTSSGVPAQICGFATCWPPGCGYARWTGRTLCASTSAICQPICERNGSLICIFSESTIPFQWACHLQKPSPDRSHH